VHVDCEGSRAVALREALLGEHELVEVGAPAPELLRDRQRQVPALAKVLVVLEGESVLAVEGGRALGERVRETPGQIDDLTLPIGEDVLHALLLREFGCPAEC
jgi:hypothetical protein